MKKLLFTPILLFLISCNNENVPLAKPNSKSLDSLNSIIQNRDSIITNLLDQKTELLSSMQDKKEINNPNKLYGKITPVKLNDYKYLEILNSIDTSLNYWNDNSEIEVSLFVCGNGPSDPEKDYCNGSYNLYVATSQTDLPPEYNLFEIGPFADLIIDKVDKLTSTVYFHHDIRGKRKNEKLSITLNKVLIK